MQTYHSNIEGGLCTFEIHDRDSPKKPHTTSSSLFTNLTSKQSEHNNTASVHSSHHPKICIQNMISHIY